MAKKYSMTLAELRKLHGNEATGGFDYCILSDVRKDDDLCIVDINATTPPAASKDVLPITKANLEAEAAKVKLTAAQVNRLGLAIKVTEEQHDV